MSQSKASAVRVRKMYTFENDMSSIVLAYPDRAHATTRQCMVVTGLPASFSTAKLKKLVEIAAMDEERLITGIARAIHRAQVEADCAYDKCGMSNKDFDEAWELLELETETVYKHQASTALEALGLTKARRRAKG